MRGLVLVLVILYANVGFGKSVYYWYDSGDTLTQGDNAYIAIKFTYTGGFTTSDTLKVEIVNSQTTHRFLLFKEAMVDLDTITRKVDGTTWIKFSIPNDIELKNSIYSITFCTDQIPALYIRSTTPDITYLGASSYNVNTGQQFSFNIDYTFKPTNQDTLKAYLGDSLIYKGLYGKTIHVVAPHFASTSNYNLTLNGWNGNDVIKVNAPTTTAIIDPLFPGPDIKIHYYNIECIEIEKPSKGLIIWKTETGESGKIWINQQY